jgi:hypothetical protein
MKAPGAVEVKALSAVSDAKTTVEGKVSGQGSLVEVRLLIGRELVGGIGRKTWRQSEITASGSMQHCKYF